MLTVAILAGGLATRMHPVTEKIPKALIDVAGLPFIVRQLGYLKMQGITKVVLCVGHLGEMIEAVIGSGDSLGIEVGYSYDGKELLGTGGAIKKALPMLGEDFFVLYGDSFLPIDFLSVQNKFIESNELGLMTVLKNSNRWDQSNVNFNKGVLVEYNKKQIKPEMTFIDYGLGVLSASVFESYQMNFDLADLYHDLSLSGQLVGFEVYKRFYEIGSKDGLKEAEIYFLNNL
jgi:MurNAc alpha-1-phosphate uridylyltransferase